jgi:hypothetical protein
MRLLVGIALLVLAITAPSSAAGTSDDSTPFAPLSHAGLLGAVPPHVHGQAVGHPIPFRPSLLQSATASPFGDFGPTARDNLTYGGPDQTPAGHVMGHVTEYAIYWVPPGYNTASNYQTVVDGYFANVESEDGSANDVFSSSTQYGNPTSGAFQYGATFGGSFVDTSAYPAGGCTEPSDVLGLKQCLEDLQLEAEIKRVADAKGWPHGANVEFFMYTPANVGSCFEGFCAYDWYCAYHSQFVDRSHQEYVYANMPWPNQRVNFGTIYPSDCDTGFHPNGSGSVPAEQAPTLLDAADEVVNVTSHEANEAITDPDGNEWWVDNSHSGWEGAENGDLCAWYSPGTELLGQTAAGPFDQLIGSGQYYTQGEWSNASAGTKGFSGCVWTYPAVSPPALAAAPTTPTGTPIFGNTLVAVDNGTWTGDPKYFTYQWDRCDGSGANCADVAGATANTYTVGRVDVGKTVAVLVTADNPGGSTTALSHPTTRITAAFPYNTSPPTVITIGTVTVGHQLSGGAGSWGASPTDYTFLWQRCDATGADCRTVKLIHTSRTTTTYTIVPGDDKHTIVLGVVAFNASGSSGIAAPSAPTALVDGEPEGGSVGITGTAAGGHRLRATTSGWSPAPTRYVALWERCDTLGNSCTKIETISGTSAVSSYLLRRADLGHTIWVYVTAANAAGTSDVTVASTGTIAGS